MTEDTEDLSRLAPKLAQLGAALNSNWLHVRATEMAEINLERPALQILGILQAHGGPLRVGEIATEMRVEGPHVTRQVTNLVRKGLVHRVVDPRDRRAKLVELTPTGDEINSRYRKVVMGWLAQAFAAWSKEDIAELVRLGERMADDFLVFLQHAQRVDREQCVEGQSDRRGGRARGM
ncbi:MarR family transcriptional regulator [Micromonospora matsumotoense]|uniref:MarR family winged helix-turn-helix transcriptional regulator n=1 Tax=Micromonospora matsumotoense TaxID=121616 RepID=UPI0034124911